jgi:hypothetical protein
LIYHVIELDIVKKGAEHMKLFNSLGAEALLGEVLDTRVQNVVHRCRTANEVAEES